MIKIATFNVNSIRARLENLNYWLSYTDPDVVLLQELKCVNEQFPFENFENSPYNVEINGQKRYNGVAILSKFPLYDVNIKLPFYNLVKNDEDARFIEAKFDYNNETIKIASIYVPNGGPKKSDGKVKDPTKTESFKNKILFYKRLHKYFEETLKNEENAIFCGDFNTCPEIIDMYSAKKDGDICCNGEERAEFKKFLKLGYNDIFRDFYKEKQEFSWWNYKMNAFEKNHGLRLDAILTTNAITKKVVNIEVDKKIRGAEKMSDHAPLVAEIDIDKF